MRCSSVQVLVDLLAAVVEPADLVQRNEGEARHLTSLLRVRMRQGMLQAPPSEHATTSRLPDGTPATPAAAPRPGGDEVLGVEVYSLALYLLVHFYLRDAHKADSSDVWPSEIYSLGQMEPSSPMRMTSHSWAREQQGEAGAAWAVVLLVAAEPDGMLADRWLVTAGRGLLSSQPVCSCCITCNVCNRCITLQPNSRRRVLLRTPTTAAPTTPLCVQAGTRTRRTCPPCGSTCSSTWHCRRRWRWGSLPSWPAMPTCWWRWQPLLLARLARRSRRA